MGWHDINKSKYVEQIKKNLNLRASDEIVEKDLLLTLILAEFEKAGLGRDLIFKGGTLLSRNYLKYHRFSEDLDFVFKDSNLIRDLGRSPRERKVKTFLDIFTPKLKEVADRLGLNFSTDRSNKRYCRLLSGRTVYTFRLYYDTERYVKIEINFIEKIINPLKNITIKAITDFFDSKELLFSLELNYKNFNVLSYSLKEITLEKYRAVLTRNNLKERDLFDLFLIKDSLAADIDEIIDKIESSSLIKKDLTELITDKLYLLQRNKFFESEEKIEEIAISEYSKKDFENLKQSIKPKLIEICNKFLEK